MVSDVNCTSLLRVYTSVICHAVLILCSVKLVSTSCKICFIRLKVLALKGQRLKYSVKIMLTLIRY